MKRTILTMFALSTLSACAGFGETTKVIDVATCVYEHERLGIAVKDPAAAEAYLVDLGKRLKAGEPGAITETAVLIEDGVQCVRRLKKGEPAEQ